MAAKQRFDIADVVRARRAIGSADKPKPKRLSAAEVIIGELAEDLLAKRDDPDVDKRWDCSDMSEWLRGFSIVIEAGTIARYLRQYERDRDSGQEAGGEETEDAKQPERTHGAKRKDV